MKLSGLQNVANVTKQILWLNTTVRGLEQASWIVNTAKYGNAFPVEDKSKIPTVAKDHKFLGISSKDTFNFFTSYSTWRLLALTAETLNLATKPLRLLTQHTFTLSQITLAAYIIAEVITFGLETMNQMRTNDLKAKQKLLELIEKNTLEVKANRNWVNLSKNTALTDIINHKANNVASQTVTASEIYKKDTYLKTTGDIFKVYGIGTLIGLSTESLVLATDKYISTGVGFTNAMFKGGAYANTTELLRNGLLNTNAIYGTLFSMSTTLMRVFSAFSFAVAQQHNEQAEKMNKLCAELGFTKDKTEADLVQIAFDSEVAKNIVKLKGDKENKLTNEEIEKNAKEDAIKKFSGSDYQVSSKIGEAMKHVFFDGFGVESWKATYKISFAETIKKEKTASATVLAAPAA